MKSQKAILRFPELEPVRGELHRLKVMWILCCLSPIAYLGLALFIRSHYFTGSNRHGLLKLTDQQYTITAVCFCVAAVSVQGAIFWVRRKYAREMRNVGRAVVQLIELYGRRTMILVALCETAIMLGFGFFLISGDLYALLVAGSLGLLYYAQSYPSEQALGALTSERP